MSENVELKSHGDTLSTEEAIEAGAANPARLLSDPQWAGVLERYTQYVSGNKNGLPRYGSLSLLCAKTPFFVYDHPALLDLCDTAFATETMVGFSKDFFIQLLQDELDAKNNSRNEASVAPLILHELKHILDGHHGRMLQFPPDISNIAQDIKNNQTLALIFAHDGINLGPVFSNAWGATKTELQLFRNDSEEIIARKLMSIAAQQPTNQKQDADGPGEPGSGDGEQQENSDANSDQQQGNEDQDGDKNEDSDSDDNNAKNSSSSDKSSEPSNKNSNEDNATQNPTNAANQRAAEDMSIKNIQDLLANNKDLDDHSITDQELSGVLEKNDLEHVKEGLGLPDSNDQDAFDSRNESQRVRNQEALNESNRLREEHGYLSDRPDAGTHIDNYTSNVVTKGAAPTIDWKTRVRNAATIDGGMSTLYTDDVAADTSLVLGLNGVETFVGDELPASKEKGVAAVLIDTSMSMPDALKKDSLAISYDMLTEDNQEDGFKKLYIGSADTSTRNDIIEVHSNERYLLEKFDIHGGGGTDFINPVKEIVALAEEEDLRLDTIIYLTDMGAYIPRMHELPENTPPIVFVTTETYGSQLSQSELSAIEEIGQLVKIHGNEYKEQTVDIEELQDRQSHSLSR